MRRGAPHKVALTQARDGLIDVGHRLDALAVALRDDAVLRKHRVLRLDRRRHAPRQLQRQRRAHLHAARRPVGA